MTLPVARILPVALRAGALVAAGYATLRWWQRNSVVGRTDQRAEDALDELGEGISMHRPADRADERQTNAAARVRRIIRFRGKEYELDAGLMARLRLRKREE